MLQYEGGFTNNPNDPGGMTNLGVTRRSWENYLGRPVTEAEMRGLNHEKVRPFYKILYWDQVKGDSLPSGVDMVCFDAAVNSGPAWAAKRLQTIVGAAPDGVIGPKTLALVAQYPAADLINAFCEARLKFMQSLPTWVHFGNGWKKRVENLRKVSLEMVK